MKELEKKWNEALIDAEEEFHFMLERVQKHFPNYEIMPEDYNDVVVPDISTSGKDLGQATIFDAVFSDNNI
jgi:hypothetical protein